MRTTSITFRGVPDVPVEFRDNGYDSESGAGEIEWYFASPQMAGIEATPEENEAICNILATLAGEFPDEEG